MDPRGFEPLVSSMPWKRDSRYATGPGFDDRRWKIENSFLKIEN